MSEDWRAEKDTVLLTLTALSNENLWIYHRWLSAAAITQPWEFVPFCWINNNSLCDITFKRGQFYSFIAIYLWDFLGSVWGLGWSLSRLVLRALAPCLCAFWTSSFYVGHWWTVGQCKWRFQFVRAWGWVQ